MEAVSWAQRIERSHTISQYKVGQIVDELQVSIKGNEYIWVNTLVVILNGVIV